MSVKKLGIILIVLCLYSCKNTYRQIESVITSKNPIVDGWYADPEGIVFGNKYWIFPTFSAKYEDQVFLDAFSSKDLLHWEKHNRVLDTSVIKWAKQSMWAPSIIEKDQRYYLFFSANDLQRPGGPYWEEKDLYNHHGGIGVAVADSPEGPYEDHLGVPLINEFHNDAQPIDQFVYKDIDGTYYMFYGGWKHCNIAILNDDFTDFVPWSGNKLFKEITPEGYVEGPFVFRRKNSYYFMWSEGSWGNDNYKVAYAMADKVTGPYKRIGTILESDKNIATGAGHNSVINIPNTDQWYIVYHRRPIPNKGRDHRVICIDKLEFNQEGTIEQVKMTFKGVKSNNLTTTNSY